MSKKEKFYEGQIVGPYGAIFVNHPMITRMLEAFDEYDNESVV